MLKYDQGVIDTENSLRFRTGRRRLLPQGRW